MEPTTARLEPDDAYRQLVDLLEEITGVSQDEVGWDSDLREDLGVDSLQIQDLVIVCERRFGIEIREEDLPDLHTVREVITHVCGQP